VGAAPAGAKPGAAAGEKRQGAGGAGQQAGGGAPGAPAITLAFARAHRVPVQVGVDGGDWLEVVAGLAAGDELVTAGTDLISDGMLVRAARGVDAFTGRPAETARTP
jgi:hypothetical protein